MAGSKNRVDAKEMSQKIGPVCTAPMRQTSSANQNAQITNFFIEHPLSVFAAMPFLAKNKQGSEFWSTNTESTGTSPVLYS